MDNHKQIPVKPLWQINNTFQYLKCFPPKSKLFSFLPEALFIITLNLSYLLRSFPFRYASLNYLNSFFLLKNLVFYIFVSFAFHSSRVQIKCN